MRDDGERATLSRLTGPELGWLMRDSVARSIRVNLARHPWHR